MNENPRWLQDLKRKEAEARASTPPSLGINFNSGIFGKILRGIRGLFTGNKPPKIEAQAPTATPTPTPYKHSLPLDTGEEIPQQVTKGGKTINMTQLLMKHFDDIKEATNAGRVLKHKMADTNIPGERERGINLRPNMGENPGFEFVKDAQNSDGTIDRGLFRINNATYNEMASKPFWKNKMRKAGITSWEDMNDPELNTKMARLRLEYGNWLTSQGIKLNPSWKHWYAAPKDLRLRP